MGGTGLRLGVVASRFNGELVDQLLTGALETLRLAGLAERDLEVIRVPGAWEIPLALQELAASGRVSGLVALGVLIRGETSHFDLIASECSRGCLEVSLTHRLPVALGVLACETVEQARERCGGEQGNKGIEAAEAALEMVEVLATLRQGVASAQE